MDKSYKHIKAKLDKNLLLISIDFADNIVSKLYFPDHKRFPDVKKVEYVKNEKEYLLYLDEFKMDEEIKLGELKGDVDVVKIIQDLYSYANLTYSYKKNGKRLKVNAGTSTIYENILDDKCIGVRIIEKTE